MFSKCSTTNFLKIMAATMNETKRFSLSSSCHFVSEAITIFTIFYINKTQEFLKALLPQKPSSQSSKTKYIQYTLFLQRMSLQ